MSKLVCEICGAESQEFPEGETPDNLMDTWLPSALRWNKGKNDWEELLTVCPAHKTVLASVNDEEEEENVLVMEC